MPPEDVLHGCDCFVLIIIHHDDSIMDRESDDTYRPEGFQDISKDIEFLTGPLYEVGLDIPP